MPKPRSSRAIFELGFIRTLLHNSYGLSDNAIHGAVMAATLQVRQTQAPGQLIGPLTTFVPSAACFTEFPWSLTQEASWLETAIAHWGGTQLGAYSCYPSAASIGQPEAYFSPGVCPEGWTAIFAVITGSTKPSVRTTTTLGPSTTRSLPLQPGPGPGTPRAGNNRRVNSDQQYEQYDPETTRFCCPRSVLTLEDTAVFMFVVSNC